MSKARWLALLCVAILLPACSEQPSGHLDPTRVVHAYIDALGRGDAAELKRMVIPRNRESPEAAAEITALIEAFRGTYLGAGGISLRELKPGYLSVTLSRGGDAPKPPHILHLDRDAGERWYVVIGRTTGAQPREHRPASTVSPR